MALLRGEIQKRIDRKKAEISTLRQQIGSLETQIKEASSYIQALEDTLKLLPKDSASAPESTTQNLRAGSAVAKARDAILAAGKPLHISEILKILGKATDNVSRAAVSGSLAAYVRKGQIFTRPAPNTFGLTELDGSTIEPKNNKPRPPPDFGLASDVEDLGDEDVPF